MHVETTEKSLGCPSDTDLRLWLDHSDPDISSSPIHTHIEYCKSCQERIESLTSFPELFLPDIEIDETGLDIEKILEKVKSLPEVSTPRGNVHVQVGDTIKNYRLESIIGKGGMSVVFLANDEKLHRKVALKILCAHPEFDNSHKVLSEARKLANIRHENVIRVLEVIEPDKNTPGAIVMEWMRGPSLAQMIHENPTLSVKQAAILLVQVARGVGAIHDAGILHCDIKPGNILLDDQTAQPRLVDFGMARFADVNRQISMVAPGGTPQYMSPEQVQGSKNLNATTDIYSLGVTLYESLTAEVPFHGSVAGVLNQILQREPVPPSSLKENIPKDLETICLKAMNKNPSDRYKTSKEFAEDLQNFLDGKPITARPMNPLQKVWRWSQRNPKIAVAFLISAISLLALGVVSMLAANHQYQERLHTQKEFHRAEENLNIVLNNIHQVIGNLQEELGARPGMTKIRDNLFKQVEADLSLLAKNNSNTQISLATCALDIRLADLYSQTGNSMSARKVLEQAMANLSRMNTILKFERQRDHLLGEANFKMGDLEIAAFQLDKALAFYEAGIRIFDNLAFIHNQNPDYLKALGAGCEKVGFIFQRQSKLQKALEKYEQSSDFYQQAQKITGLALTANLQSLHSRIAETHSRLCNHQPALESARLSLEFAKKLTTKEPEKFSWKMTVLLSQQQLAIVLARDQKYLEAESLLAENLEQNMGLVKLDPLRLDYLRQLALCHSSLADLSLGRNQRALAIPHTSEAIKILTEAFEKDPESSQLRFEIIKQLGRKAEQELEQDQFQEVILTISTMRKMFEPMKAIWPAVRFEMMMSQLMDDQLLVEKLKDLYAAKNISIAGLPAKVAKNYEIHKSILLARFGKFDQAMQTLEKLEETIPPDMDLSFPLSKAWGKLSAPENPKASVCAEKSLFHIRKYMIRNPEFTATVSFVADYYYVKSQPAWSKLAKETDQSFR